jgi:dihydroneopterin aldolase
MTKMLASVMDKDEAEIVISGGADIVDLKNPNVGALGALPVETIGHVVKSIAGRRATSAVCGDLPMEPETIRAKAEEIAATGVDFVKIGFFPSERASACAAALAEPASRNKLIAVLFADRAPDFGMVSVFAENGFHGVMVDTADKAAGRLLDHLPPERMPGFIETARDQGLKIGLAGSLEAPDIPRLLAFNPDFLGFRGALCDQSMRTAAVDAAAVSQIRSLIPEERSAGRAGGVDYRLLAARGYAPGDGEAALGTDRIFVRDFVLPVQIGAYSFEHGHTQKVRFDVSADVLRVTAHPEDMRHVFSYDVIMDGIRAIVARGHVMLAETLAEQVAAYVLESPLVTRVTVKIEKLEIGPGGVGVEIERKKAKERHHTLRAASPKAESGHGGKGGPS